MKEVANAAAKTKRRSGRDTSSGQAGGEGQGQGQGQLGEVLSLQGLSEIVLGEPPMGSMGSPDCAEGRVRVGDPADPVQQAGWMLGQRLQELGLIAEGR